MKLWIMIFSVALFAGGTCLGVALQPKLAPPAAAARPPEPSWGDYRYREQFSVQRFAEELDLTAEQDHQLDLILDETRRDLEAYGRAMRSAHERSREKVTGILSEEQKKKLEALMAQERERRSKGELDRKVESYRKILALNEEQARALAAAFSASRGKKRDFFSDRRPGGDYRAFSKTVREEQNQDVKKALTPEQYARYLDLQELQDHHH
jgi:Spy/CpxP family protein refolding chaperone